MTCPTVNAAERSVPTSPLATPQANRGGVVRIIEALRRLRDDIDQDPAPPITAPAGDHIVYLNGLLVAAMLRPLGRRRAVDGADGWPRFRLWGRK